MYPNLPFTKEQLHNPAGIPKTQVLFREHKYQNEEALLTIAEDHHETEDGRMIWSIRKLYLDIADPTEHIFAKTVFGSWKHWLRMKGCKILREEFPKMQEELRAKLLSESISNITEIATNLSKPQQALQASKFLVEFYKPEKTKPATTRGRPSKEEVEGNLKEEARVSKELQEHMKRVGLTRVK